MTGEDRASVDGSDAVREAFVEAHREHVEDVRVTLPSGDPEAIKRMYVDFGERLHSALRAASDVPALSVPETLPVVSRLLEGAGGLILDAGCGPNPVAAITLGRRSGRRVVALDIAAGNVKLARKIALHAGVEIHVVVGDLESLPFAAGSFDGCVCDDTIEHIPDDGKVAEELSRVVKPGGRIVLATPNRHSLLVLYSKLLDRVRGRRLPAAFYFASPSHLREYSWSELKRLLAPQFLMLRRADVAWRGSLKLCVASKIVALPLIRRLGRMHVVELSPSPAKGSRN